MYSKFQSHTDLYRNYITTFRVDKDWSALMALQEDMFLSISDNKDKSKGEGIYKMLPKEKELLENFQFVLNNGLLRNKTNIDVNGKATISDPATGRPIYIGEGAIPQLEAAANKFTYVNSRPTINVFNMILNNMSDLSEHDTGNHYMFVVNRKLFNDVNTTLGEYLANYKTDGTYMYSKEANKGTGGYVKVGNTFSSYEYAGNTISFSCDRALSREFPNKGYGVCIDLTGDKTSNTPAISRISLKGKDFITNKILGVGGYSGGDSGEVSHNVAGSKLVMMGYAGIMCATPFKSAFLYEL